MASVAPCDSASASGSCYPSEVLGLGRSLVEPPLSPFGGQSVTFGELSTDQVKVYGELMNRYYDSYNSYLLVGRVFPSSPAQVSSAGSVVSGGSAGSSLSGSRVRSARRAAAWREKQSVVKNYPEGFCYTRLFVSKARQSVALSLSSWPTLSSVLSQPADLATSLCLNEGLRLVRTSVGYHVSEPADVPSSSRSWPLNDALVGLARRHEFPQASFGSDLKRSVRGRISSEVLGLLSPSDLLGGTSRVGAQLLLDGSLVRCGGNSFSSSSVQFDAFSLGFEVSFASSVSVGQSVELGRAVAGLVGGWVTGGLEGSSVAWLHASSSVLVRLVFRRIEDRDLSRLTLSQLSFGPLAPMGPYISFVAVGAGSVCVLVGSKGPQVVVVNVGSYSDLHSAVASLVQLQGVSSASYQGSYASEVCTVVLHVSSDSVRRVCLGAAGVVAALRCAGTVRAATLLSSVG